MILGDDVWWNEQAQSLYKRYKFATSNLILIDTPLQLASPVFVILFVFLVSGRIGSSSCNILICGMKNFLLLSSCSKKTSEITRRGTIGGWTKTWQS